MENSTFLKASKSKKNNRVVTLAACDQRANKVLNKNRTNTIKSPFHDRRETASEIPIQQLSGDRSILEDYVNDIVNESPEIIERGSPSSRRRVVA